MSIPLVINGNTFAYPVTGDDDWGPDATNWAVAVTAGMLQKAGGLFQLLGDVNFGANFGLISKYFTSTTANAATTGAVRLAVTDSLSWRNNANTADLALSIDASNNLLFNGTSIGVIASVVDTATIDLTLTGTALSADIKPLSITNALISASAAIAYSKLTLTGSIVNADVATAAGIVYTKLNLTASIVNADIASAAAIAVTKLAALTVSRAVVTDGSGFLSAATTTSTEIGYVSGVTSAIQTQIDSKQATGNYISALTGDVTATGPGSVASTIATNAVTNAKFRQSAGSSLVGNPNTSTGNVSDITGSSSGHVLQVASGPSLLFGPVTNGNISSAASIILSKLQTITVGNILIGTTGTGVITSTALSGDATITGAGVITIANNVVTNAKAAQMTANTIKGNNTGATANQTDLTGTNVTAMLNVMGGATTGGTKGLVPSQISSDAGKFLTADGAWVPALSSPMTAAGQMIYGSSGGAPGVVAAGTSGQYLKSTGTTAPVFTSFIPPTVQKFTTGSGTYTTPAGVMYIRVRMVGGGGGGAGSGVATAGSGGTGGNSTFGTTLLVANGGVGATAGANSTPAGGTASLGTGPVGTAISGAPGGGAAYQNVTTMAVPGGSGGATPFGGAGSSAYGSAGGVVANTGSGGGGGGAVLGNANMYSGSGGGAAGYVEAIIGAPAATYAYAIGAAGTAGTAGTGGINGGVGSAGYIEVTEHYQS